MRHRMVYLPLLGMLSVPFQALAADAKPHRPNVIVILSDDNGYNDVGYQGMKDIPTPHIDAFAHSGVRFSNGYVSCPVCSPTRAGLQTGRYQERFGHELNPGPGGYTVTFGLPLDQVTIADRMKAAGYATGQVGKWHLGSEEKYNPLHRGYDEYFGFAGGAHDYFRNMLGTNNAIQRNGKDTEEPDYLTDAFTREAVSFIDRHAKEPFFLYLAYNAVHSPLEAPPKYLERFPQITEKKRHAHAGQIAALDDGVGKVIDAVHAKGLDETTLIFFLADNGGPTPSTTSSNLPLRGIKGTVYEGGVRIPFCVRWTGQLPKDKVYDNPVISLDIMPTALAVAGGTPPSDRKLDGVNILPYLTGEKSGKPHETLYWRFGAQDAIRHGDWKLLRRQTDTAGHRDVEMYNLADDLSEKTNLVESKPDKAKELTTALESWESELVPPLWNGKPRFQPGGQAAERPNAGANPQQRANRAARRAQRQAAATQKSE